MIGTTSLSDSKKSNEQVEPYNSSMQKENFKEPESIDKEADELADFFNGKIIEP